MPTCSMGILTLLALFAGENWLAGTCSRSKLRHRPWQRSGIGVLVGVVAGPYQRSGLDVAEAETQSLLPQIRELCRFIEAGNRQVIFRRA